METKPYRLQAPEDIAKEYGGNKQKIAEAMQIGLVDPTAGVLAGMFIDRMRSAQMQEMAQRPTVAQQVMGGAPAQAPLAQTGGLGATAPAQPPMAPMAPQMEAPMPEEAPMGMAAGGLYEPPYMAGGGLSELPIPDTMFDENRNGGYASGGIIAFAGGSPGQYGQVIEETALSIIPNLRVTSRQRSAAKNAAVKGVPGSYHLTGDARDFVPPEGMSMKDLAASLKSKFGGNFDVIDEGDHVHVEPGPSANARPTAREANIDTARGREISMEDSIGLARRYMQPDEEELAAEEKMRARLEELGSDEYYEKQRKDSMWETLASIGFNMASSKAPRVLQAIGEAAAAALPGAKADKKERKALKDRALEGLIALGARDRERANEAFKVGVDIYRTGVEAEQAEKLMAFRREELRSRENIANLDRMSAERIQLLKPSNPSDLEVMMAIMQKGTPAQQEALKKVMELKQPGMKFPGDEEQSGPWNQYRQ
jgi:hypothetical protein